MKLFKDASETIAGRGGRGSGSGGGTAQGGAPVKKSYKVDTKYGSFSRNSAIPYKYVIARKDGWHQFSQSEAAANKELKFQQRRYPDTTILVKIPE